MDIYLQNYFHCIVKSCIKIRKSNYKLVSDGLTASASAACYLLLNPENFTQIVQYLYDSFDVDIKFPGKGYLRGSVKLVSSTEVVP